MATPRTLIHAPKRFPIYSDALIATQSVDLHRELKKSGSLVMASGNLDVSAGSVLFADGFQKIDVAAWLPQASKELCISADPSDYVIVPVPAIPSDLPNRNGVGFPLEELSRFSVDQGRLVYQTWIGKPLYVEHDNQVPARASGLVVDSIMRPLLGFSNNRLSKVVMLAMIDRTKNPKLAENALSGTSNAYSMGALVEGYSCGYCGAAMGQCAHLSSRKTPDFYMLNGKLVYRAVHSIVGFELSNVEVPAWVIAHNDPLSATL